GSNNSSASAALLGTVAYISPEVVTRGHADERSDLYSLGIVLFEMLTGRQPFRGEQPVHIAFQHVHEDIPAPSSLVTGVPRELDSLVTWAAARQVEQRPATAADLLRAVRELTATLPAAVLDSRPAAREMADTSDVPRMTTSLEEGASGLDRGPRAFPAGLLAPGGDVDPPTIAEEGRDLEEQPDSGDGPDGAADRSARGPAPAQDEPEGDRRVVVLRAPRTPRGRHLPQGVRRRSRPMALLAALCLVATLAVGGWLGGDWYLNTGPGADRTVPLVVGTPLADAEAALTASDLSVSTREQFDDTVPAGHVISVSPSTGSSIKKGEDVQVVVSKGEQTFPVPQLVGLDRDSAHDEVGSAGLELVEDDREYSETVPEGAIISQSAAADALPAGGEVHVVVSQGRQPIQVPDQRGRGGEDARAALE